MVVRLSRKIFHLICYFKKVAGDRGVFCRSLSLLFLLLIAGLRSQAQHHIQPSLSDTLALDEVIVKGVKGGQKNNVLVPTDRILEATPGISMIRRGNFAMEPVVRSLSNGQISVTIDGMRIFGACTDRMDPVSSYIEPNNLGSITVTANPGENQFGGSVGGGINFKLKDPGFSLEKKMTGSVGTGYETNGNAFQTFAGLTLSKENVVFQVDGIYRKSNNYRAGGGDVIQFSQYEKWNGHVSGKFKISRFSHVKAEYLQDEGYNIGYPALTMDVAFAKAKIASISYVYQQPEQNFSTETKVYYNFIDHAMDDTKRPKSTVPIHMDMPGSSRTVGFYSSFSKMLNKKHHLEGRIDGFNNELSATMTMYPENASVMFMYTLPDLGRTSAGVALNDHYSLNDKVNLRVGGRLEYLHDYQFSQAGKEQLSGIYTGNLSRDRVVANLNAGIDYQWHARQKLSADVSRGSRSATLQEGYGFYIFNRVDAYDYMGNPNLKKETSVNVSLGYTYTQNAFTATLSPFAYFFNNYIVGEKLPEYSVMTIGANGVKRYVNINTARLLGANLLWSWLPVKSLKVTSNSSYTQGKDSDGHWLPLIAPFRSINSVTYIFQGFTVTGELVSNGAQKKVSSQTYGEFKTPGSNILNINAGQIIRLPGENQLKLLAGVENVFDTKYVQHLDVMKIARPGRNIFLRATFTY